MAQLIPLSRHIEDENENENEIENEHEIEVLPPEGYTSTATDSDLDFLADVIASIVYRLLAEKSASEK